MHLFSRTTVSDDGKVDRRRMNRSEVGEKEREREEIKHLKEKQINNQSKKQEY